MLLALVVLMDYSLIQNKPHEVMGIVILLLFFLHVKWNWSWFKNLSKGKYTPQRRLVLVIDTVLLIAFLGAMITGFLSSHFVLRHIIPMEFLKNLTIHRLHNMFPYLMIVFLGLHLGLHWSNWWNRFKRFAHLPNGKLASMVYMGISMLIAVAGGYAYSAYRVTDYLMMVNVTNLAIRNNILIFGFWHLMLIGLFVVIGYVINSKNNK